MASVRRYVTRTSYGDGVKPGVPPSTRTATIMWDWTQSGISSTPYPRMVTRGKALVAELATVTAGTNTANAGVGGAGCCTPRSSSSPSPR